MAQPQPSTRFLVDSSLSPPGSGITTINEVIRRATFITVPYSNQYTNH